MTDNTDMQAQGEEKYGERTYTARVKWFNRTAGWGFASLTKSAEEHDGDDIFVHWKSLDVGNEQYKYLVNGEYVSLKVKYTPDGQHSYQASAVTGIDGGQLMCETRNQENESRRSVSGDEETDESPRQHRGGQRRPRGMQTRGPREARQGEVWKLVQGGGGRSNRGEQTGQRFNRDRNTEQERE